MFFVRQKIRSSPFGFCGIVKETGVESLQMLTAKWARCKLAAYSEADADGKVISFCEYLNFNLQIHILTEWG